MRGKKVICAGPEGEIVWELLLNLLRSLSLNESVIVEGKMMKDSRTHRCDVLCSLCLIGEWTGHHWQDPGRACGYAEEHKTRGNCQSDCGSSGGGLSTSRAGKVVIFF